MNDPEEHVDTGPVDLSPLEADVPPPGQETRIREALRARGTFDVPRRRWAAAAAAALLFAAGTATGAALERRDTGGVAQPTGPAAAAPRQEDPAWAIVLLAGPGYAEPATSDDRDRRVAALARWARELAAENRLVLAEELGPPVLTLPAGGPADGTSSGLGLFIVRAPDADAAAAIAGASPHLDHGGRVAVQPVVPH